VADVEAPGGEKWEHLKSGGKQWQATPKNLPRMRRTRAIPVAWLNSGLCPDRPKGWIPIIIIIIIIIITTTTTLKGQWVILVLWHIVLGSYTLLFGTEIQFQGHGVCQLQKTSKWCHIYMSFIVPVQLFQPVSNTSHPLVFFNNLLLDSWFPVGLQFDTSTLRCEVW